MILNINIIAELKVAFGWARLTSDNKDKKAPALGGNGH